MARRRTNGFTLIELLTVLVIAGILIGLAIPAVTSLMSSGGVDAASREVANTLGLARQVAITQRVYARVVFPYGAAAGQPDTWFRTYAVITNRDNTVANGWIYMTKWEYLPIGAVFLKQNLNLPPLQNLPPGGGALDDSSSLAQGSGFAYIEFGPTGAATPLTSGGGSTLAITEGFAVTNATPATIQPTASKTITNTLANLTTISVDSLVGRIQVVR